MRVRFWGVRGSIPVPGPDTVRYGGNTSCIEVRAGDQLFILDAGTGLRELGNLMLKERNPTQATILISHTHWDHIQGFPFFMPIYVPGFKVRVCGPDFEGAGLMDTTLEKVVCGDQMEYLHFPVDMFGPDPDPADPTRRTINLKNVEFEGWGQGSRSYGAVEVVAHRGIHPILCLMYRVNHHGKSVVYTGDLEYNEAALPPTTGGIDTMDMMLQDVDQADHTRAEYDAIADFMRGADLLIADACYTDEEYKTREGWGHSTFAQAVTMAVRGGVKQLALFHHEPTRSDAQLEVIERSVAELANRESGGRLKVFAARERMEIEL